MAENIELYNDCGYLEIIKGPMFSGKTTWLLEKHKRYSFCGIKTMVINYEKDNRYSDILLSSHDKVMIPCIKTLKLTDLVYWSYNGTGDLNDSDAFNAIGPNAAEFLAAKVILINEGQFFSDIVEWVTIAVEQYHKTVYVCGLNCDFQRQKFGNWLDLEPICNNIVVLHSFCSHCKSKPALFSHRLSNEAQIEIIGSDNYIPVCRKCYHLLHL
jgi:thymidine kinase